MDQDTVAQAGHVQPVHHGEHLPHQAGLLHLPGHQRPVQQGEHLPHHGDRPVHLRHRVPPGLPLHHVAAGQSSKPLEATRPAVIHSAAC